jgi:hypothetical protein
MRTCRSAVVNAARRPPGLGLVALAHQMQRAVGQSADVHAADRAQAAERLMPGRPPVRIVADRLRTNRVDRVVESGRLPVGADRSGLALPGQPAQRLVWDWSERPGSPLRLVLDNTWSNALLAQPGAVSSPSD